MSKATRKGGPHFNAAAAQSHATEQEWNRIKAAAALEGLTLPQFLVKAGLEQANAILKGIK